MAKRASTVATGIYFGEGPRWHDGRLWFSDFFAHAVKTLDHDGHVATEFALPDDRPSGLGWLPDGRMLVVSMLQRKVLRREHDGSIVTHADLSSIAEYHTNDMVVDAEGRAYVGNFGFDLDEAIQHETVQQLLHEKMATLARVDPDGSVHVAATDMKFPNGSVITPDGGTLIVAESLGQVLTAFTIADDGSLHDRRVWADLGGRVPDGICLDAESNIWVANALAPECFLVAEDGGVIDVVETGDPCYACMLGGDDGRTLYCITAPSSLAHHAAQSPLGAIHSVHVDVPHAGLP
jgi:sugar lactone lactonase YvrE